MNNTSQVIPTVSSENSEPDISETGKQKKKNKNHQQVIIGFRTASRFIAVQALYALDISKKKPSEIIAEIHALYDNIHAVEQDNNNANINTLYGNVHLDNQDYESIFNINTRFDIDYTISIIHGVMREQRVIDPLIVDSLPEKWTFNRLDYVMRAILRIGVYELLFSPDIPQKVTINEYTNIASTFDLNHGNSMVNGILNAIYQSNKNV